MRIQPRRVARSAFPLLLVGAVLLLLPQRALGQFGELPADPNRIATLSGVVGEIAFNFFADPEVIGRFVPTEYDLIRAADVAASDSSMSVYLEENPGYRDWVLSGFTISAFDSIADREGDPPRAGVLANWAVPLASFPLGLPDPVPPSAPVVYNLATWEHSEAAGRKSVIDLDSAGTWHLDIAAPGFRMDGACSPTGPELPATYSLPAYLVMVGHEQGSPSLAVLTFYGHRGQECVGTWRVSGDHPLAVVLRDRPAIPGTWAKDMIVSGWRTKMGVYERAVPNPND